MAARRDDVAAAEALRGWAWRLLSGTSLADKLALREQGWRWTGEIPDLPGRPAGLELRPAGAAVRAPFPAEHELGAAEGCGRALHFFANHELMALELMALTILRFPEAPQAFHQGLAGVMADEQRHLQAYVERMVRCGVQFGDLPVNRYFWDALALVPDPSSMVAGLSLTFEAANLDFAAAYAAAFRRVGDEDTAGVLDTVLADEIRHVRHGLAWFDRWRQQDRWEAWLAALPYPLTPARARGPVLAREARRRAGFEDVFTQRVERWGGSRGRPPAVWSFNPGVEAELAGASPAAAHSVQADLAGLLALLATPGDVVVVPRVPTEAHLEQSQRLGVPAVEWVTDPAQLVGRTLGGVRPWGRSPALVRALRTIDASLRWDSSLAELYRKTWSTGLAAAWPDLCDQEVTGVVCRSWAEVQSVATAAHVVKAPLGTAGRGMRRWSAPDVQAWTGRVLRTQGAVVVEPWLDRVADLSVQLEVDATGGVRVWPLGRFLTDSHGRYLGAVLGRPFADLPADVRRLVHNSTDLLREVATRVGEALRARGHHGPAGIDALVWRRPDGGVALKPLVEVNPRLTMGRVALAVERHVRPGRVGLWAHVSHRTVPGGDLETWARGVDARAPLQPSAEPSRIDFGAWWTTDPRQAREHLTVLIVAEDLDRAQRTLAG